MLPLVSINLLTYNSKKYIKFCLHSVLHQSYPNTEILIIDNNSTDGTQEEIKKIKNREPRIKIILNKENTGYSGGHNQGIQESKGKYVLCLNPDIILEKDYVKNLVGIMERDKKIGLAGGKLIYYDFKDRESLNIIDSVGIIIFKNRRVVDKGQGKVDQGQYDKLGEIFGISGSAPLYRRQALEDTKICLTVNNPDSGSCGFEYFDNIFFVYKEDVDMSWRMHLFGWKCIYNPQAIAHHHRKVKGRGEKIYFADVLNIRKQIPAFIKRISYRNHHLMMVKNELGVSLLKNLFPILRREILLLGFICVFEPKTLPAIIDFFKLLPKTLAKRKEIMTKRKVGWREMERWFK